MANDKAVLLIGMYVLEKWIIVYGICTLGLVLEGPCITEFEKRLEIRAWTKNKGDLPLNQYRDESKNQQCP